jgi:CRP-like cAMP-binding protein
LTALPKFFAKTAAQTQELSLESRIQWLNQVRLFEEVKAQPGALDRIAAIMAVKSYSEGTSIIKEGEEGSDAFFLISGAIKVLKSITGGETFPVAILEAKDHPFFGEAALLQNDKRSATILAVSDCTCLVLDKRAFDQFCANNAPWALPVVLKIARVVLERLQKANNDVVLLYNALVHEVKGWQGG